MKPLMSAYQIAYFKRSLLNSFKKNGGKIDVLEWGSGGSTVYFTKFLRDRNIPYSWTSIEYNKGWHEKVSGEVKSDPNTEVVLFDVGNNNLRQRHTDMEDYIKYPSKISKKFDLIFVDGRKRRRCLIEAKNLVKEDGVVFLHDACRKHYQCAFSEYPNQTFVSFILWKGRIGKTGKLKIWWNKFRSFVLKNTFMWIFRPLRNFIDYFYQKNKLTLGYSFYSKIKFWYLILILFLKKRELIKRDMSVQVKRGPKKATLTTKGFYSTSEFCENFKQKYALN